MEPRYIFNGRPVLPREEVVLPHAMELGNAIALVRDSLPIARNADTEDPRGLAVYPPRNFEGDTMPYVVQLHEGFRDAFGNPPRVTGQKGVVGCIFRDRRGPVIRCWFPGDDGTPAIGPVDVRAEGIAGIPALFASQGSGKRSAVPLLLPGWAVGRMDTVVLSEGGIVIG